MLSFIYFFKIDANPVSVNMLREKKKSNLKVINIISVFSGEKENNGSGR